MFRMLKVFCAATALSLILASTCLAAMNTAYIVASDQVFASIPGLRDYLANGGVVVVHLKPEEIDKITAYKYAIVLGSPDGKDKIGEFLSRKLTEKELEAARRMGTSEILLKRTNDNDVMIFATSYSIKSLVQGTSTTWAELFESWYNIPQSMTTIIGY